MAGTATHLAVADRIYESLGEKCGNKALFFCGNIAPDAIHARENYERAFKKVTHLTEGISGADFQKPDKLSLFYSRVSEFIDKHCRRDDAQFGLYLGYAVHLLTDGFFNVHIREQFVSAMKKEGITQEEPEFFRRIMRDIDAVDRVIVARYPYQNDVRMLLDSVWDYEIRGFVTADEINRSKRWVIDTFFDNGDGTIDSAYYDYTAAARFICFAADEVTALLSDGKILPKVL